MKALMLRQIKVDVNKWGPIKSGSGWANDLTRINSLQLVPSTLSNATATPYHAASWSESFEKSAESYHTIIEKNLPEPKLFAPNSETTFW